MNACRTECERGGNDRITIGGFIQGKSWISYQTTGCRARQGVTPGTMEGSEEWKEGLHIEIRGSWATDEESLSSHSSIDLFCFLRSCRL